MCIFLFIALHKFYVSQAVLKCFWNFSSWSSVWLKASKNKIVLPKQSALILNVDRCCGGISSSGEKDFQDQQNLLQFSACVRTHCDLWSWRPHVTPCVSIGRNFYIVSLENSWIWWKCWWDIMVTCITLCSYSCVQIRSVFVCVAVVLFWCPPPYSPTCLEMFTKG